MKAMLQGFILRCSMMSLIQLDEQIILLSR